MCKRKPQDLGVAVELSDLTAGGVAARARALRPLGPFEPLDRSIDDEILEVWQRVAGNPGSLHLSQARIDIAMPLHEVKKAAAIISHQLLGQYSRRAQAGKS